MSPRMYAEAASAVLPTSSLMSPSVTFRCIRAEHHEAMEPRWRLCVRDGEVLAFAEPDREVGGFEGGMDRTGQVLCHRIGVQLFGETSRERGHPPFGIITGA